jgi:hypothetical protein
MSCGLLGNAVSRCALIAVLAGVLFHVPNAAGQGDLRRIRAAIHPGPKLAISQPPATSVNDNGSWFGVDPDYRVPAATTLGPAAVGLTALGVAIATSPFWGPHELYDAGFDERGWFPAHPHVLDNRPYMVIGSAPREPTVGDDYFDPHFVKPWALRLSLDAGNDFDDLSRFGGQLFLDTSICRLGFLANLNYYRESMPGDADDALMSDANLTWRVTQSPRLLMHLGGGVRTWTFDNHTDVGINGLYRADIFPCNHLHLSGIFEIGNLGEALVLHAQAQAGFTLSHGEVFLGYDWLRIGDVALHGPAVGLRLWF